jgi:hypothetical protein
MAFFSTPRTHTDSLVELLVTVLPQRRQNKTMHGALRKKKRAQL